MQDNGRGRHGWKHGTVWLLGGLLALAAAVLLRWPPAILAVDLNQTRLDRAMPAFSPTHTLQQTFVPGKMACEKSKSSWQNRIETTKQEPSPYRYGTTHKQLWRGNPGPLPT